MTNKEAGDYLIQLAVNAESRYEWLNISVRCPDPWHEQLGVVFVVVATHKRLAQEVRDGKRAQYNYQVVRITDEVVKYHPAMIDELFATAVEMLKKQDTITTGSM